MTIPQGRELDRALAEAMGYRVEPSGEESHPFQIVRPDGKSYVRSQSEKDLWEVACPSFSKRILYSDNAWHWGDVWNLLDFMRADAYRWETFVRIMERDNPTMGDLLMRLEPGMICAAAYGALDWLEYAREMDDGSKAR